MRLCMLKHVQQKCCRTALCVRFALSLTRKVCAPTVIGSQSGLSVAPAPAQHSFISVGLVVGLVVGIVVLGISLGCAIAILIWHRSGRTHTELYHPTLITSSRSHIE